MRELAPLETWIAGRVALLGDAAHAMLPNLGQGGCQAIEDAVALAASLADGVDVAAALTAYEARRKPRAEKVARESRRVSTAAHLRNPVAVTLRNLAMSAMPARATLRRLDDLAGSAAQPALSMG